jgi:hypothetical protein
LLRILSKINKAFDQEFYILLIWEVKEYFYRGKKNNKKNINTPTQKRLNSFGSKGQENNFIVV